MRKFACLFILLFFTSLVVAEEQASEIVVEHDDLVVSDILAAEPITNIQKLYDKTELSMSEIESARKKLEEYAAQLAHEKWSVQELNEAKDIIEQASAALDEHEKRLEDQDISKEQENPAKNSVDEK